MNVKNTYAAAAVAGIAAISFPAQAFIFFFPIPNLAKPAQLNTLIDALEKSDETKAVALVSEDKTFGSKYWVWGHYSGHVPQAEADRVAMARCQTALANAKAQTAGGKPLYDYGTKSCELYSFANKAVSVRANEWQPTAPPAPPAPAPAPQPSSATAPAAPPSPASVPGQAVPTRTASEDPPKPDTPASAPQTSPQPAQSQPQGQQPLPAGESPTARKLRELEVLRRDGLITEVEYQEKRKAIIAAM